MNKIRIVVNEIPPSNNVYLGKGNKQWKYQQDKGKWHWLVKAAIKKRPKKPYQKATVRLTYFFEDKRARDPDNYSGKFILDALVKESIITDDSFDVIDLVLKKGGVDRNNPRTVIEVEEA